LLLEDKRERVTAVTALEKAKEFINKMLEAISGPKKIATKANIKV
jgi:hypothetical protein